MPTYEIDDTDASAPTEAPKRAESADGRVTFSRDRGSTSLDLQILAAIAIIICGSMAGLGYWVGAYMRSVDVQTAANSNAFHMNLLLEPVLRDVPREGVVPAGTERQLDDLLSQHSQERFVETAVVWWRDGTVAYSTDKPMMGRRIRSPELDAAFEGEIVVKLLGGLSDHGFDRQQQLGQALLEVYVPLRDPRTRAITAVGEFYQNATHLQSRTRSVTYTIWGVIGTTTLLMLSLLIATAMRARTIVGAQRNELRSRLSESQRLARQNEALRIAAEDARRGAFKTNENFLNQIGSDLHDGPIQLLSLVMLRFKGVADAGQDTRADKEAQEQAKTMGLVQQTIRDLRNLALGLALPELDELTVRETLMLAIERHESQTGSRVKSVLRALPEQIEMSLKICLYRLVQECLNNAFKHAGGRGQRVAAGVRDGHIEVVVSDGGPGIAALPVSAGPEAGLGMAGLKRRLQTFGGTLHIDTREGRGTRVSARLPLDGRASVPVGAGD